MLETNTHRTSTIRLEAFACVIFLKSQTSHKTKTKPYCNTAEKVLAFKVKPEKRDN